MEQAGTYLRNTRSLFWDKNVYREAVKKYNTKVGELSEVGIDLQPLEM